MRSRVVGAKLLVDVEQFAGIFVQISLQSERHLVEIAVDGFDILADFEERGGALRLVGDKVCGAEVGEFGIRAVGISPKSRHLANPCRHGIAMVGITSRQVVYHFFNNLGRRCRTRIYCRQRTHC